MDPSAFIYDAWLFSLTSIAAITDARSGTIPNWLTLPTLAIAPLVHGLHSGPGALAWSVAGIAACAAVPVAMFRCGAMGGGDVKLFAAVGALGGVHSGLALQVLTYVLAATAMASWLVYRGQLGVVVRRTWAVLARSLHMHGARESHALEAGVTVRLGVASFAACVVLVVVCAPGLRP